MVRQWQDIFYKKDYYATHYTGNPDFVKLAESFGAAGYRVNSPAELQPVLEKAIDDDKPAIIDVIVERGSEASPWKYIHKF